VAVDLIDGELGIEARHTWLTMDTATVLARLGDLTTDPHYRIRDISGLFDFPDIEDNNEPITEAIGLRPYASRARGKNVTYSVDVRASTLQLLRRGGADLRAGFGPDITTGLVSTRSMIITPHPDYGSAEHVFAARCVQLSQGSDVQDRGETAVPTPWVRSVVIGLKLHDPRIYEWDPDSEFGYTNPKW
jgi:hypothetical protein